MNFKNITVDDFKRVAIFLFMAIGVGFCASLSLKADVGLAAWDGLSRSLSYITDIKVGTLATYLNIFCVVGQIVLLRKKYKWVNILQFAVSFIVGNALNYFYYDLFGNFDPENYYLRLLLLLFACVLMAICLSFIVTLDVIGMPVEFFCSAIVRVFHLEFGKVRQYFDFVVMGIVILLTFVFKVPLTLREGTFIMALLLGPLISFFIPYAEKVLLHLKLIEMNNS